MNFLLVALVSVILTSGVFNTEPKDSEENKKTEIVIIEGLKYSDFPKHGVDIKENPKEIY